MDIIAGGALVDVAHMLTDSTSNFPMQQRARARTLLATHE
jgi:hypothetical protein